jgi:hypothetical protein
MQYPGRRRLPFRPFRWVVWVFLLLIAATLWMVMLRSLMLIPTPADVDRAYSYFSPLPAAGTWVLFRLNAPLFGWQPGSLRDPTGFSSVWSGNVPEDTCVTFSSMGLQIVPGTSWGSFVHWQVRPITICG